MRQKVIEVLVALAIGLVLYGIITLLLGSSVWVWHIPG